ncbi:hypothetical protein BKA82DRAFT_1008164 [Pisolithus tinctorius]|uniref:Uncharacterized protein n=1 Tax=Pisolithus tinctorius Marx 270 TaxID=870435 RepID=A0A0C3NGT8_PISTI|nr:hypothetical protein BKA82DRAFT_1008164 [Pisolithus tinctorius]KIN94688.1 hypothetical protein M404DRAFT_1008164 [Pisolithus tinctorius Marx 270]
MVRNNICLGLVSLGSDAIFVESRVPVGRVAASFSREAVPDDVLTGLSAEKNKKNTKRCRLRVRLTSSGFVDCHCRSTTSFSIFHSSSSLK